MTILRRMTSLKASEAAMLAQALAWVVGMRIAMWTVPSARLLRFVQRRVDRVAAAPAVGRWPASEIAWSVRAVGRRVPKASCLVQALAVQLLLARNGYGSELRVGVKTDDGEFAAHAWVEHQGRIIVGGDGHGVYTPLPDLRNVLD
jgi:hypothetical protein